MKLFLLIRFALLGLSTLFCSLAALSAQTIYVDVDAGGADSGTSWTDAYPDLQSALAAATSGDQIWVAEGNYYPDVTGATNSDDRSSTFTLLNGVALYGGFTGTESLLSERDTDANPTVLSGDLLQDDGSTGTGDNAYHVVTVTGTNATAVLDGFTITAGNANAAAPNERGGGLVGQTSASPTLRNILFFRNNASIGGAIYLNQGAPSITDSTFQENSCSSTGGAIYLNSTSAAITNTRFLANESGGIGGAAFLRGSGNLLTNTLWVGNVAATNASAITVHVAGGGTLINATITQNDITDDSGAAVSFAADDLVLQNCIFWDNLEDGLSPSPGAASANNLVEGAVMGGHVISVSDPQFLSAPNSGDGDWTTTGDNDFGDLRLSLGSPARNVGDDSFNATLTDLSGSPRKVGTIDLGAFERPARIYVDADAVGNADGLSWSHAFPLLQDALTVAASGDEIWVAEGTYYPDEGSGQTDNTRASTFTLIEGVQIYGGFDGGESLLTERDIAGNSTILSGDLLQDDGADFANNGDNAYHVVTADGSVNPITSACVLDGLIIIAGNAEFFPPEQDGGGLLCKTASPRISNCRFQGNRAIAGGGGGIANVSSSSPIIINCSFQGNEADQGGGIHTSFSSPFITNCSFQGNNGVTYAGAISNDNSPGAVFANIVSWNNKGRDYTGPAEEVGSVIEFDGSATYFNCLIEAFHPPGGPNLDGTDPANNPDFVLSINPGTSPNGGGDVRLTLDSPALDAGDSTFYTSAGGPTTDLDGRPRISIAGIDLGAFEFQRIHVDHTAAGANDGSSWTNAFTKLQDALATAQAGDDIWVAGGTYYPDEGAGQVNNDRASTFTLIEGVQIYGGFAGSETLLTGRNITGNPTILSGDLLQDDGANFADNGDNAYHVVTADGSVNPITSATILDGFTITAGNANDFFPDDIGGGLYCDSASPTLTNCIFLGNSASSEGGGIFNLSSDPTIANCSFLGNNAGSHGGGILNLSSDPTLTNCSLQGNSAGTSGGGIYNVVSSPTLTNCSFQGNSAGTSGGGIYNFSSDSPLTNCSLQGNRAGTSGGGIYSEELSSVTFANCLIWNNAENGLATTTGASVASLNSPDSTYSYCLVENWGSITLDASGSGGTNNLDGTNAANDPLFTLELDPATAPATGGDLRLSDGSPALDTGDNTANVEPLDLGGEARIQNGTIDLGAYEGLILPEIVLEYDGIELVDNVGTIDLGFIRLGLDQLQDFPLTIRNVSNRDLGPIDFSISGASFLPIPPPNGSLAPYTFRVESLGLNLPEVFGPGAATLSATSNDADESPFEIHLIWFLASETNDADGDGLDDFYEYTDEDPNTDPFNPDTDGDGINDGGEIYLSDFDFENGVDNSDKVALLQAYGSSLGLYEESALQSMAVTQPVITRDPITGKFTLHTELFRSPDLETPFVTFPDFTATKVNGTGELLLEFDPPTPDAHFFQIFLSE